MAAVSYAGSDGFKRGLFVGMIHLDEHAECTFLFFLIPLYNMHQYTTLHSSTRLLIGTLYLSLSLWRKGRRRRIFEEEFVFI